MTLKEARTKCLDSLLQLYPKGEAEAITEIVLEHISKKGRNELKFFSEQPLLAEEEVLLDTIIERLNKYEPVQYITNEAWFFTMPFYVDRNVLIPRPETEELVHWIIADNAGMSAGLKIIDIGTGSGCIPVSIKRKMPTADVWACDISDEALFVAKRNAETNAATVKFTDFNFLDKGKRNQLPVFDIIVSNPPYVPERDKQTMHLNVLNYEPHLALFVEDNDPLLFYREIADFAVDHLVKGGNLYLELYEEFGKAVSDIFIQRGFTTELREDMQRKERMIKCTF